MPQCDIPSFFCQLANAIRPYWKAFSLKPSPEMARRDM